MAKPKKKPSKRPGRRGPPPDSALAIMRELGADWQKDAEKTLLVLQAELRSRVANLDAIELIGAIRAIGETLTTSRALVDPEDPENPPGPAPAPPPPPAPKDAAT